MSWEVVSCWIESHPGLASWVQAVGSIGAIIGAFAISYSQNRRHERLKKEDAADRFEAYYSVLKNSVETCMSVARLAEEKVADFEFREVWNKYLREMLRTSLEAARAIPAHELSDYKLVVYYSGIVGSIHKFCYEVERYAGVEPKQELTLALYETLKSQSALISFDWEGFQERALPKRKNR
ncbi:hypothetical protein [Pseudomonas sp. G5(2012)]|uniref:hypothetical protein n=1 Tax=Pseudomonas sp. G5(2012) TaxID=1268068 RepID=UPI0005B53494|nr:hypothetical protein [Pseudomonas sp. G5(2012)]